MGASLLALAKSIYYTDTETDVLICPSKNLTLKRCYVKNGRGANILCNLTQAMLTLLHEEPLQV